MRMNLVIRRRVGDVFQVHVRVRVRFFFLDVVQCLRSFFVASETIFFNGRVVDGGRDCRILVREQGAKHVAQRRRDFRL